MMGRVAKAPITIPGQVEVSLLADGEIKVKGKQGELAMRLHPAIEVLQEDNELKITKSKAASVYKNVAALAGTMQRLVANMVHGVSEGFIVELELRGVGYRAAVSGAKLTLSLGFSHPVEIAIPEGIKVEVPKQTELVLKGCDKQKVTQFAANIRRKRPPEPYKGKGVRYKNEVVKMKEGKKK